MPLDALGNVAVQLATVKPEDEKHIEIGLKTNPWPGATANITAFHTTVDDYQVNVVNGQVGVLRGYLANAEQVIVQGVEFDGALDIGDNFKLYGNVAWTDGKFEKFTGAPPALEDSGGAIQVVDASGTRLSGLSEWAGSLGGEFFIPGEFSKRPGRMVRRLRRQLSLGILRQPDGIRLSQHRRLHAREPARGLPGR